MKTIARQIESLPFPINYKEIRYHAFNLKQFIYIYSMGMLDKLFYVMDRHSKAIYIFLAS